MDALSVAEHFIYRNPSTADAAILERLLRSLRSGERFNVHELYELNLDNFDVAMEVLNAWRLQRYYRGGAVFAAARSNGH